MKQSTLANWLKAVLIGCGVCGLVIFGWLVPAYGANFVSLAPEVAYCYWPWLIFAWLCALPCFGVLVLGYKIAVNIGKDNSFSFENARLLKHCAVLAGGDTAFFMLGNWALVFMDMSHPGVAIILAPIIAVFGVAAAVALAALSHLVYKSAVMKAESDLTI